MTHATDRRVARSPEGLHAVIETAFNEGDLDAYAAAFEDDATLVTPPDGSVAHGRADIRAATAPIFALGCRMTMTVLKKVEGNGIALTHGQWRLEGQAPDGTVIDMRGRGTMVSRQRTDGSWGIVLDDPLSPEERRPPVSRARR